MVFEPDRRSHNKVFAFLGFGHTTLLCVWQRRRQFEQIEIVNHKSGWTRRCLFYFRFIVAPQSSVPIVTCFCMKKDTLNSKVWKYSIEFLWGFKWHLIIQRQTYHPIDSALIKVNWIQSQLESVLNQDVYLKLQYSVVVDNNTLTNCSNPFW